MRLTVRQEAKTDAGEVETTELAVFGRQCPARSRRSASCSPTREPVVAARRQALDPVETRNAGFLCDLNAMRAQVGGDASSR